MYSYLPRLISKISAYCPQRAIKHVRYIGGLLRSFGTEELNIQFFEALESGDLSKAEALVDALADLVHASDPQLRSWVVMYSTAVSDYEAHNTMHGV